MKVGTRSGNLSLNINPFHEIGLQRSLLSTPVTPNPREMSQFEHGFMWWRGQLTRFPNARIHERGLNPKCLGAADFEDGHLAR